MSFSVGETAIRIEGILVFAILLFIFIRLLLLLLLLMKIV